MQAALNTLPPKDRGAVVLRYWYDLSYEEIAAATDSTVSAVKSRLHRARGMLAGMFSAPEQAHMQRTQPLDLAAAQMRHAAA